MPSITTFTICTRSPVSTYCGGTLIGIVDGYASDLFCCSAATGGTFSVWLGLRPSPATAAPPCKVLGGIIGAWDVISSKRSLSYQPWFPPLLSKEGGSVRVLCQVYTILKFTTTTQLSMILMIQTKCSDTNCNNLTFQAQNNGNYTHTHTHTHLSHIVSVIGEPVPSHHQDTIYTPTTINISFKNESYINTYYYVCMIRSSH